MAKIVSRIDDPKILLKKGYNFSLEIKDTHPHTDETFTRNVIVFYGDFEPWIDRDIAEVVIWDTTSNLSITYNLDNCGPVQDTLVVPIGDIYTVTVNISSTSPSFYEVTFISDDCQQVEPNVNKWAVTMGTSIQQVSIIIRPRN